MALPLFATEKNKWPGLALTVVIAAILYGVSNHIQFFPPRYLELSATDLAVPLVPWTIWIYLSEYIMIPLAVHLCKDMKNLGKLFYTFMTMQIICVMIFVFFPVAYPREKYPLIESEMDPFTFFGFTTTRLADAPTNCMPSLHVATCLLVSFLFLKESMKKFAFFFIWTCLVAASTLTTKQHYLFDVSAGALMAVTCYFVFQKWVKYREPHSPLP